MNQHLQRYIERVGAGRVHVQAYHLDDCGAPAEMPELPDSTISFVDYEGWLEIGPDGVIHRHLTARGRRVRP